MSVAGKTKKDIVTEFRTAEILEAARKVFAVKGVHGATVDEIADAAGVAKGTVYLYYRSKQDLYLAALKFGIAQMSSIIVEEIRKASTVEEKLKALIAAKLAYFDDNRDFFKIYYSELGRIPMHPGAIDSEFKALSVEQARLVESILREGARKKDIRSLRYEQVAFAISDMIRGVVTQRVLGWSKTRRNQDVELIFDLVWKGIAAR